MYVLDVIVLSRSAPAGTLSYRSTKPHVPGTLLSLDLRKQQTLGVVTACDPALYRKAELKLATYTLRGSRDAVAGTLPEPFMRAAQEVATWHAASPGSVLSVLLAELQDATDAPDLSKTQNGPGYARQAVEQDIDGRADRYRTLIESAEGTTLLVVPTLQEVAYWKKRLAQFKPQAIAGARKAANRTSTRLIIASPERSCGVWATSMPAQVIVERAGSGSYSLVKRPHLDVRRVHELFTQSMGIPFILGDLPLPLEFRPKPDAALASPIREAQIVDMRRGKDDQSEERWQVLPEIVVKRVREALEHGERVALLGVRAGYAPAIVCRDCGQTVTDERGRSLTFSQEGGERIFRSADGEVSRPADVTCSRCGSWNLLPLGVGVERIREAAQAAFPATSIAYLPSDVLKSRGKTVEALVSVSEGGLIVGTEAMLPFLLTQYGTGTLSLAVVVSADSLLAVPFWRARERFVRLALFLTSLAQETVVITRRPDDTAVTAVRDPMDPAFFVEEAMLRKALRYPPYATLVSLNRTGTESALARLDPILVRATDGVDTLSPADTRVSASMVSRTTVLTFPEGAWPDVTIAAKLAALPPSVRVRVDPEALW